MELTESDKEILTDLIRAGHQEFCSRFQPPEIFKSEITSSGDCLIAYLPTEGGSDLGFWLAAGSTSTGVLVWYLGSLIERIKFEDPDFQDKVINLFYWIMERREMEI